MILLSLLLSLNTFAMPARHRAPVLITEIKCKHESELMGDGCNVCTRKICTDNKSQWQAGPVTCSSKTCSRNDKRNQKPYNPKDWSN